ncbi:MAG: Crp/Fnr family transcriptional regulator [Deltaproteobacteria bacterium]|nr:Crp/Fnr family transcriptional regulator [Deltaproteobacteria bacterium]
MQNISFGELFAPARTSAKSLGQGEFLFRQGDPSSSLYTVLAGGVRLVRYTLEGNAVVMHTARPGDSLAEASLFSEIYHCDAEAVLPSIVACYDKGKILAMLREHPEKSLTCIALFARQVRSLRALLEVRSIRSARDRVLHYLLLQADPVTMEMSIPAGSLKAMALKLAMAHETLYRTLANLESEGKINRNASIIKIHH